MNKYNPKMIWPRLPIAGRREPRRVRSASTGTYVPKIGKRGQIILGLYLFITSTLTLAAIDENRYNNLTKEIRCVVCQNQNIADSNAPLAIDLRKKIYTMVEENKSDNEIKDYLVARYGEFILLKPRFSMLTIILWLFPFTSLAAVLWFVLRRYQFSYQAQEVAKQLDDNFH